jgi:hypothetical protein
MSRLFGPVRQLGYVVHDLQQAMDCWIARHGVGPFIRFEQAPIGDLRFRGAVCKAQIAIALAQSGPLQIELIALLDQIDSPYREFLRTSGEGLQHVAYWTTDFASLTQRAASSGMRELLSGYTGAPDGRFAYLESGGHPGSCIEISALSPGKTALFDAVARASIGWDGSNPVRAYRFESGLA